MIDKKTFKKEISAPLEAAGFAKKGQSWYLDGNDSLIGFQIRKSDWEDRYYIDIGIWLKALGDVLGRGEYDWHLSHRLESLFPEERLMIRQGLAIEQGREEFVEKLADFIRIRVVPFLLECTNEDKLRAYMLAGRFRSGFVRKDAKSYMATTE